jgi:hypothetical protein
MAGAEPAAEAIREAKLGGDETPVFANPGVKSTNVSARGTRDVDHPVRTAYHARRARSFVNCHT